MKKLFIAFGLLVAIITIGEARAQKENVKVIKKSISTDDGKQMTSTDTIYIDADGEGEHMVKVIRIHGDSLMKFKKGMDNKRIWISKDGEFESIVLKDMEGREKEIELMVEQLLTKNGDSIESVLNFKRMPYVADNVEIFKYPHNFPPPPPPVRLNHKSKYHDPLQSLLEDPDYEIVKFNKSIKKGVEKIEIERKKK